MIEIKREIDGNLYKHHMRRSASGEEGWEFSSHKDRIPTHVHPYGHDFAVIDGEIDLVWPIGTLTMRKGDKIYVPAGMQHRLEFRTEGAWGVCTHVFREADGTIVPFDFEKTRENIHKYTSILQGEGLPNLVQLG